MRTPRAPHPWLRLPLLALLALGSLAIVVSSLDYLSAAPTHPFLFERPALTRSPLWRCALLLHVSAGLVCLPGGLALLWGRLARRHPRLHRRLGRVYVGLIVGVMTPTGIYLACFAKGGAAAGVGFALSGVFTAAATLLAVRSAVRGDLVGHRDHMLRAYAQVSSAISFRVFHMAFQLAAVQYEGGYIASLWLSIVVNALIAEAWIQAAHSRPAHATPKGAHHVFA